MIIYVEIQKNLQATGINKRVLQGYHYKTNTKINWISIYQQQIEKNFKFKYITYNSNKKEKQNKTPKSKSNKRCVKPLWSILYNCTEKH